MVKGRVIGVRQKCTPERRVPGSKTCLACLFQLCHYAVMSHTPNKSKKSRTKPNEMKSGQGRANQFLDLRRQALATRSTLSRLRNRKSDLK